MKKTDELMNERLTVQENTHRQIELAQRSRNLFNKQSVTLHIQDLKEYLTRFEKENYDEWVVQRNLEVGALCTKIWYGIVFSVPTVLFMLWHLRDLYR